jgi:hypothetical protein
LAAEGKTLYQIPHGKGALYEGFAGPTESELDRLPGGRAGTAWIVEAKPEFAVPWTKPDDVEIDDANVRYRLNNERAGTNILFHDMHIESRNLHVLDQNEILRMFFPRAKRPSP